MSLEPHPELKGVALAVDFAKTDEGKRRDPVPIPLFHLPVPERQQFVYLIDLSTQHRTGPG